jgi:hypothetical protein
MMRSPQILSRLATAKTELSDEALWNTPPDVVDAVRKILGVIELDPCTTPDNPVGACAIIAPPDDGILLPWNAEKIYVNPPYGATIKHWADKVITVAATGAKIVALVPTRSGSEWFHRMLKTADDCLLFDYHLRFWHAKRKRHYGAAGFPSTAFGYNTGLWALYGFGTRIAVLQ